MATMTTSIPATFFGNFQSLLQGPGNVDQSMTNAHYIQGLSINKNAVRLYDATDNGNVFDILPINENAVRSHDAAESGHVFDISAVPELVSRHRCDDSRCNKSFKERKSLYRHKRTVHKIGDFRCSICKEPFKRHDILRRHRQTQHEAEQVKVKCPCCEDYLRPRSLRAHIKSRHPTDLYATWWQLAFAKRPVAVVRQGLADMHLLPHLAEPRDPIMLGVSLFVKYEPWGEDHRWLKVHHDPDPDMYLPHEVRKLTHLLEWQIAETQPLSDIDQRSPIPDVLAILCVFVGQTKGWDPAMRYCKPLVMVAIRYLMDFGPLPYEFYKPSPVAVEVFTTILLRNLPAETAATCKVFMVKMLKLLRRAAITTA